MEPFDGKVLTRKITTEDKRALLDFNKKMYPNRINHEISLSYRVFDNPLIQEHDSFLCHLSDEKIIGQIFLLPSEIGDKNKSDYAVFGSDYIVDEAYRGTIAGTNLCKKATKVKYHFGINLSEISLKMHRIFKENIIGYIHKYMYVVNPLLLTQIVTGASLNKVQNYPDTLTIKESTLKRVFSANELKTGNGYFTTEHLAFKRDHKFMDWRFFNSEHQYYLYAIADESNYESYIVVRPIIWKKFKSMLVVDYRYSSFDQFKTLLRAAKRLATKNKCFNVIVTSSMSSTASLLKQNRFIQFGEIMNIVSNYENEENKELLLTYADSDIDLQY